MAAPTARESGGAFSAGGFVALNVGGFLTALTAGWAIFGMFVGETFSEGSCLAPGSCQAVLGVGWWVGFGLIGVSAVSLFVAAFRWRRPWLVFLGPALAILSLEAALLIMGYGPLEALRWFADPWRWVAGAG